MVNSCGLIRLLFLCINDWELHRIQFLIRSKCFFCKMLNVVSPARQILSENSRTWCQHAFTTELFPSLQVDAINEVGIMSLLLWISTNRMWVFLNRTMKLHLQTVELYQSMFEFSDWGKKIHNSIMELLYWFMKLNNSKRITDLWNWFMEFHAAV